MSTPLFLCGLGIWTAATIALRLAGQRLLPPNHWTGTLALFTVSFPLAESARRRRLAVTLIRPHPQVQ